ncbi:DnaD domain-containing protein [Rummeliibacillus stabekisii]|uniref:DnaD domain-containing protein n=1 Tax=Rummeliibacillus stabekisii TaxID=241244 RepID=UPI001173504B|nr:DnaD domain-containing protein [Rummeliibacillus stabekisii]MBB5168898.1 DNA replication protein [Rummeliibacillus stabekisii]GEL04957.1 DNA replication protein [Rummeliibacillus stabekisii]
MKETERLQVWIEQGNVTISQLFFQFYKLLQISDEEAMLIMHLNAFQESGNSFPTPANIAERMTMSEDMVATNMQRLMQKGYMEIHQKLDEQGVLYEVISLMPLWKRILDYMTTQNQKDETTNEKLKEGQLFQLFEQEFGRFLSPMETEMISMWLDQDRHTPEVIRKALMEAVLSQKLSLRYIDRILFEWKKNHVKTIEDAEKHSKNFRKNTVKTTKDYQAPKESDIKKPNNNIPFYNWLDQQK